MKIKLQDITPDPEQPRKTFKEETLQELRASYNTLGLIQPITVRPHDGRYTIIVGERRYRAAKIEGFDEVECIIREGVDNKTIREMQFAENAGQESIPPLELGQALRQHRNKYSLSQRELANIIGIAPSTVEHFESLCTAAVQTQEYVKSGKLDASTAVEISTIKDKNKQAEVAQVVVDKGLARSVVRKMLPIMKARPDSPVEHIAVQAQYGIKIDKMNGQAILNELKKQQIELPELPQGKFRTIVIDPPWAIEKIGREVRPNQFDIDYPTAPVEEIMAFPIPSLACEDGCHIYLWTTHKHLPDAFAILGAWGANYECLLTWVKNVGFTPFSWMYSTEHCLFARIGNLPLLQLGKRLDFQAKVREHSRKPDEFYNLIREVSPEPRLDYSGREPRTGFTVYGNEPNKFTDAKVLSKVK